MTLRALRQARGLTQAELAKLAGVTQTTISILETSGRAPGWATAFRIAAVLRVRPEDVFPVDLPENGAQAGDVPVQAAPGGVDRA